MITLFGIESDGKDHQDEHKARLVLASAVIEHIEEKYALSLTDEVLNQIKSKYEIRIQRLQKNETQQKLDEKQIREFFRIQQELLRKERMDLIQLRREGRISDEALRKIEYELDLEETRLLLEGEK